MGAWLGGDEKVLLWKSDNLARLPGADKLSLFYSKDRPTVPKSKTASERSERNGTSIAVPRRHPEHLGSLEALYPCNLQGNIK